MSDVYGAAAPLADGLHAWNWSAKNKLTGKVMTFYTEPTRCPPAELLEKFKAAYHQLDFADFHIEEALNGPQKILKPIPPELFQFGIIAAVKAEARGRREQEAGFLVPARVAAGRNLYTP